MNDVVDTRTKNGWTATIYYDQGCENPRDDDSRFLFLGLKHRSYVIGDETIDLGMDCPKGCDGGFLYNEATDATDIVCDLCSGEGRAISLDMLEAFIEYKYKPLHMRRVGMGDHSRVWYYLGGGAAACDPGGWDSGTAGFMLYLPKHKEVWGLEDDADAVDLMMKAELEEYTDWCNGACYGYIITDINGDEVDSCWGLIGDYGEEETMRVLDVYAHTMKQPETLHDVRLTDRQIDLIRYCLGEYNAEGDMEQVRDAAKAALNGART